MTLHLNKCCFCKNLYRICNYPVFMMNCDYFLLLEDYRRGTQWLIGLLRGGNGVTRSLHANSPLESYELRGE